MSSEISDSVTAIRDYELEETISELDAQSILVSYNNEPEYFLEEIKKLMEKNKRMAVFLKRRWQG